MRNRNMNTKIEWELHEIDGLCAFHVTEIPTQNKNVLEIIIIDWLGTNSLEIMIRWKNKDIVKREEFSRRFETVENLKKLAKPWADKFLILAYDDAETFNETE